ncbi:MAG: hypothetical protein KGV48_001240 [Alcaligenaceae bacterium]|nr:hypothetical protein [Alcaligenaceae bacterium]
MQFLYPYLLIIHLLCAIMFIGTVFVEVLLLEGVRKQVSDRFMKAFELAFGNQAVKVMPFVIIGLFGSGLGMLWLRYLPMIHAPLSSSFALLLTVKIILAISVLGHFITAMLLRHKGKLKGKPYIIIHISVFCHVLCIAILAKAMFYIPLNLPF